MSVVKGNIVVGKRSERHGIVLAVTKDGKRARVYVYGPDREEWLPVNRFTVEVSGLETCHKCGGSGVYQGGGMVLNGRFTGFTGECYACEGKGQQTDRDRVRCHHYWHRQREVEEAVEAVERGEEPKPLTTGQDNTKQGLRKFVEEHRKRKQMEFPHNADYQAAEESVKLIDCPQCGTLHRSDIGCPWQG